MGTSICSCNFNGEQSEENFYKKEEPNKSISFQRSKPQLNNNHLQSKSRIEKKTKLKQTRSPAMLSKRLKKLYSDQSNVFENKIGESDFIKICKLQIAIKVFLRKIKNNSNNAVDTEKKDTERPLTENKNLNEGIIFFTFRPAKDNKIFGIKLWKDNAKYIGFMKKGSVPLWNVDHNIKIKSSAYDEASNYLSHGFGIFSHSEGDEFRGEFLNDETNGYGIYIHQNGASYEGSWNDDSQNGIGIETWSDGSYFYGNYKNGMKDGIGNYFWHDGSIYAGQWKNNNLEGVGIYYFADKRTYSGEWKNNSMHGYGEFLWPDGKKYVGFYENDHKEGFGIYLWTNPSRIYVGLWKNGRQSGIGRYLSSKSTFYGFWENGEKQKVIDSTDEAINHFKKSKSEFALFMSTSIDEILNFLSNIK